MNKKDTIIIGLILLGILITGVSLAQAQSTGSTEPIGSVRSEGINSVSQASFPVQGNLTDSSGKPLNGDYDLTFRIYEIITSTTPLCTSIQNDVKIEDGLFTTSISCGSYATGRSLYLGVEVENDGEMTPREEIHPVPYAISLAPGAVISASLASDPILKIQNWGEAGTGMQSYAMSESGVNYAIVGTSNSPDGFGTYSTNSGGGIGIFGRTNGLSTDHPAVFGCIASDDSSCISQAENAAVQGYTTDGVGVEGSGTVGVNGIATELSGSGLYGQNTAGGIAIIGQSNSNDSVNHWYPTLYLLQGNASGDFIVGSGSLWGTRYWRVDRTGRGYFANGTQTGGADFAEQLPVQGDEANYEPGDVLVISTDVDKTVELSSKAFATTVIGVYSTEPGVLAGAPDSDDPLSGVPVAVVGVVPCKVSTENGAIQRGDLLVTSNTPGYAMKAGENPPQGTVLGKAMQPLADGSGVILILVTLQ